MIHPASHSIVIPIVNKNSWGPQIRCQHRLNDGWVYWLERRAGTNYIQPECILQNLCERETLIDVPSNEILAFAFFRRAIVVWGSQKGTGHWNVCQLRQRQNVAVFIVTVVLVDTKLIILWQVTHSTVHHTSRKTEMHSQSTECVYVSVALCQCRTLRLEINLLILGDFLNQYYFLILVPIGVTGNILSFLVSITK